MGIAAAGIVYSDAGGRGIGWGVDTKLITPPCVPGPRVPELRNVIQNVRMSWISHAMGVDWHLCRGQGMVLAAPRPAKRGAVEIPTGDGNPTRGRTAHIVETECCPAAQIGNVERRRAIADAECGANL